VARTVDGKPNTWTPVKRANWVAGQRT